MSELRLQNVTVEGPVVATTIIANVLEYVTTRSTMPEATAATASTNNRIVEVLTTSIAPPTIAAPGMEQDNNSGFIWMPLAVLLGIIALSALVFMMSRNRRRLVNTYFKRKHTPSFTLYDDSDVDMENGANGGEDYDNYDDPSECLLKGRLQIDNQRYNTYQTTDVTQSAFSKVEQYT